MLSRFCFLFPTFAQVDDATKQLSHDILKELIEINTTDSVGNVTTAAEAMAKRLRDAGFPESDVQVLGPNDRKKNMVARLRGTGKQKPVLLIGHLDVVEARREDWSTDPFKFVEQEGFYYGRGTQDMKGGDAIMVTTLIRMKKEGYKPDRDIILALTADEEGGKSNGVDWLLKNHRDLIDAEFVLNHDGGGITSENGKPVMMDVDATEKLYADYQLMVTNPGGHSSLPVPDNAIYHLANGLVRLEHFEFPIDLNSVTRAYYERMSKVEKGQRAEDMKAILERSSGPGCDRPPVEGCDRSLENADDLRGHSPGRRARQQRAAADGQGQRELPHRPWTLVRRYSSEAGGDSCRSQDFGEVRRRHRRRDGTRFVDTVVCSAAAAPGRIPAARKSRQ